MPIEIRIKRDVLEDVYRNATKNPIAEEHIRGLVVGATVIAVDGKEEYDASQSPDGKLKLSKRK